MLLYTQELKNIKNPSKETLKKVKKTVNEIKQEIQKDGCLDALSIAYQKKGLEEIKDLGKRMDK